MRSVFLALVLIAAAGASARADDPLLREAAELPGFVMFGELGAPGLVLAVVRGDDSLVLGYGETEKGNHQTPDGNSLVRLNSITKVFATEVLACLVAEGKLRMTDTLAQDAGDTKMPAFNGRQISLLDLATHSAALPREMGEAPEGVVPRAWPTRADRWKWLRMGSHFPGRPARWPPIPMSASTCWPTRLRRRRQALSGAATRKRH